MTVAERLDAWWLRPIAPARLALVRVTLGVLTLVYLARSWGEVPGLGATGAAFRPVGVGWLFPASPPAWSLEALQVVLVVLATAWISGRAWRFVAPAFAVVFTVWASLRLSYGAVAHDLHLATVHILVLALLPAGSLRRTRAEPGDWTTAWVIRTLMVVTVLVYVFAGVSKLLALGPGWADGSNLRAQVAEANFVRELYDPTIPDPTLVALLRERTWLLPAGAVHTLIVELGAPFALVNRRVAVVWALATWFMHGMIAATMGIVFPYQTFGLAFLVFLPVERLLALVQSRPNSSAAERSSSAG